MFDHLNQNFARYASKMQSDDGLTTTTNRHFKPSVERLSEAKPSPRESNMKKFSFTQEKWVLFVLWDFFPLYFGSFDENDSKWQ